MTNFLVGVMVGVLVIIALSMEAQAIDPTRAEHGLLWEHQVGPYSTADCSGNPKDFGVRGCQYHTCLLALKWIETESRPDWPEFADAINQALNGHPMPINTQTGAGISAAKAELRKDIARETFPFFAQWDSTLGYPDWPDTAALGLRLLQGT